MMNKISLRHGGVFGALIILTLALGSGCDKSPTIDMAKPPKSDKVVAEVPADADKLAWQDVKEGGKSDFALAPTAGLTNASFEQGITGWTATARNGATGQWAEEKSADGGSSIVIRKNNGRGWIALRTALPVTVTPGEKYTFRAFYQTENAPLTANFLLRIEKSPDALDYDSSLEYGNGLGCQRSMINTPPGKWTKFYHKVTMQNAYDKVYVDLILEGNPCTVRVNRVTMELFAEAEKRWAGTHKYSDRPTPEWISEEEMRARVNALPESSARLEKIGGMTTLLVDDKPASPVLYKHNPGLPEYHLGGPFLKSGVKIQMVDAKFDYKRREAQLAIWNGHEQYDFNAGIKCIEMALRGAPEALLVIELGIGAYADWGERYPDELWRNRNGEKAQRLGGHMVGFSNTLPKVKDPYMQKCWQFSYFSSIWRKEAEGALRAYIRHLKTTPYAKRIVGFMIAGGHDGQFALNHPDHSQPAMQAFRGWLKAKYVTDADLAKAWNMPEVTFADADIPDLETGKYFNLKEDDWIYDPKTEQRYVDYRIFVQESTGALQDEFARICKEEIGKDVICFRYFMSGLGNAFQSAQAMRNVLKMKYIDAIGPQPMYGQRKPGKTMVMRQVMESFHQHNKLVVMEFDHRTWLRTGGSDEMTYISTSFSETPEDFAEVQAKLMGEMIARGHGFWYYDMVAGWYHDPVLQKQIAAVVVNYERLAEGKRKFRADVAVIADEETVYWLPTIKDSGHAALHSSQIEQLDLLQASGVPYDFYYLEDLVNNPELRDYKTYVFLTTWRLTTQQRAIIDALKNHNRTLVWMYAPGYLDGVEAGEKNMELVTGMQIRKGVKTATQAVLTSESNHPLAKGLLPMQGVGYLARVSWLRGKAPNLIDFPRFYADDPQADILARFETTGEAAIAVRDFKDWRSVYIAAPGGINPEMLNNIAKASGAYVLTQPGILMEMNSRFISLHGLRSGRWTFALRYPKTIRNLRTDEIVARKAKSFSLDVEAGKSYWLGLE